MTCPRTPAERLVPEAYAQHGHAASAKLRIASTETPASAGVQGPGETTTRPGCAIHQIGGGRRVVAHHVHLGPQLTQVLHEVVGEGVVVVDDEDLGHAQSPCSQAR